MDPSGTSAPPASAPVGPTPEAPPTSAAAHFASLDGFRALAALAVLLAHVSLLSGLNGRNTTLGPYLARADVGVSIFFLLSGFLLYRPFVAARLDGRPTGDLGRYVRRRALRILPAYWVALTVVAFVLEAPGFGSDPAAADATTGPHSMVAHYLLLHVYDLPQVTGGPVQQSWSLATEVAFYAFLPVWAWLLARRVRPAGRQVRVEAFALAGLWLGAVALKLVALALGAPAERFGQWGTWLPFRLDEFALGMGMAVASAWIAHRGITLPAWVRRGPTALACWAVAAALFWFTSTQLDLPVAPIFTSRQHLVVRLLYAFTALFLLLPAVFGRQGRGLVHSLFANPVIAWFGLISYGIYIWHEAWQDMYLRWTDELFFRADFWNMLAVTLVLSVACAAASWYLVERPVMRRADRSRPARPVPVSAPDESAARADAAGLDLG